MNADRDRSEAPAGLPLHEPTDRDASDVPSEVEREALRLQVADLSARIARYERHAEVTTGVCCVEYGEAAAMAVEQAGNAGFMEAAADAFAAAARREKDRAQRAEAEAERLRDEVQKARDEADGWAGRYEALRAALRHPEDTGGA